jgi:hypothetical protein
MIKNIIRKVAYWTAVAAVLAGTAAGIYFGFIYTPAGSGDNGAAEAGQSAEAAKIKQKVNSINLKSPEITHLVDGRVKWNVKAKEVVSEPDTGKSVLRETSGKFFGRDGNIISFLAPLTTYDPALGEVRIDGVFSGKVGKPELALEGSNLRWSDRQEKLTADNASLQTGGTSVRGDRVNILPNSKTVNFEGNVQIEMPIKKKKK